jgi:hypothetical protein
VPPLQAQLNQRVLASGQTGVLPPINYHAVGVYGAQGPPVQQQQQQPIVGQQALAASGIGGIGVQQAPQMMMGPI